MTPPRGLFTGLTTLDLVQRVDRLPGTDGKVQAHSADLAAGGPAANAAVAFRALGGRSVLLSALGPGPIARLAADDLHRHGVDVVDTWQSGGGDLSISAITVLDGTGERSVVSRNAEGMAAAAPDTDALVASADVLLVDGHHPVLALAAARSAHRTGVPVVLDCGSERPVFAELAPLAATAVCSACFTVEGAAGFDAVATGLLRGGTGMVAMSDGAHPVRWRTRRAAGSVEVPRAAVRDTLGAGDVLHGALAFAWACGVHDPQRSLRFAVAVAAVRVEHAGPRAWTFDARLGRLVREELR
ncbi:MAG: PfkB family carbohydrate kinase [Pseudonocardiaceae bacterium]